MSHVGEPNPIKLAPSREYGSVVRNQAHMVPETIEALKGPGDTLNVFSSKDYDSFRSEEDLAARPKGVVRAEDTGVAVEDIPNPNAKNGRWNPLDFMPRFIFEEGEDAFPVSPAFDNNTNLNDNAPGKPEEAGGNYQDGVVGGDQPLRESFHVTQKGPYTVLTYGLYMAHNKAGKYHRNDYAAGQIYLKPNQDGKLEPAYVATTWHRGVVLIPWKDVAKDKDGRPVLKVQLGTHAIQAVGKADKWDEKSLTLDGKGNALFAGKPLEHKLTIEAFQSNVDNAMQLVPGSPAYKTRSTVLRWGGGVLNPYMPSSFDGRGFSYDVKRKAKQGADKLGDLTEAGIKKVKNGAEKIAQKAEDGLGKLWNGLKGLA